MYRLAVVAALIALVFAQTVHAQTTLSGSSRVQFSVHLTQPAAAQPASAGIQMSLTRPLEIQQLSGVCDQTPSNAPATVRSISITTYNSITPLTPIAVIWSAADLKEKPVPNSWASVYVPVENGIIRPTQLKVIAMPNGAGNALSIAMNRSSVGTVASCFITVVGEWK